MQSAIQPSDCDDLVTRIMSEMAEVFALIERPIRLDATPTVPNPSEARDVSTAWSDAPRPTGFRTA